MASSMVAPRAFHFIEVDEARGILKKTSQNRDELLREIDYYRSLPKELQYLFPRIIDASIESEFPSVEIEYYGYPTLHSFFMSDDPNIFGDAIDSHNFDEDIFNAGDENLITAERENVYAGWKKIFERMKTAVDDMKRFPHFEAELYEVLDHRLAHFAYTDKRSNLGNHLETAESCR